MYQWFGFYWIDDDGTDDAFYVVKGCKQDKAHNEPEKIKK